MRRQVPVLHASKLIKSCCTCRRNGLDDGCNLCDDKLPVTRTRDFGNSKTLKEEIFEGYPPVRLDTDNGVSQRKTLVNKQQCQSNEHTETKMNDHCASVAKCMSQGVSHELNTHTESPPAENTQQNTSIQVIPHMQSSNTNAPMTPFSMVPPNLQTIHSCPASYCSHGTNNVLTVQGNNNIPNTLVCNPAMQEHLIPSSGIHPSAQIDSTTVQQSCHEHANNQHHKDQNSVQTENNAIHCHEHTNAGNQQGLHNMYNTTHTKPKYTNYQNHMESTCYLNQPNGTEKHGEEQLHVGQMGIDNNQPIQLIREQTQQYQQTKAFTEHALNPDNMPMAARKEDMWISQGHANAGLQSIQQMENDKPLTTYQNVTNHQDPHLVPHNYSVQPSPVSNIPSYTFFQKPLHNEPFNSGTVTSYPPTAELQATYPWPQSVANSPLQDYQQCFPHQHLQEVSSNNQN